MTGARFTLGLLSLSLGLAFAAACDSEKGDAAPPAPAEAPAQADAPAQAPAKVEVGVDVAAEAPPVVEGPSSEPNPDAVDRTRFPDPEWFKPDVLPLSAVKHKGHTKPDEQGFFASNLTLETEVKLSAEDCVAAVQHQVGDAVPSWGAAETADGRITIRGDADRYQVTLVCGIVKGKTTASVNYRWTK